MVKGEITFTAGGNLSAPSGFELLFHHGFVPDIDRSACHCHAGGRMHGSHRGLSFGTAWVKQAATNFGWLAVERGVRLALSVVVGFWVARHLGPAGFGTLNYCFGPGRALGDFSCAWARPGCAKGADTAAGAGGSDPGERVWAANGWRADHGGFADHGAGNRRRLDERGRAAGCRCFESPAFFNRP